MTSILSHLMWNYSSAVKLLWAKLMVALYNLTIDEWEKVKPGDFIWRMERLTYLDKQSSHFLVALYQLRCAMVSTNTPALDAAVDEVFMQMVANRNMVLSRVARTRLSEDEVVVLACLGPARMTRFTNLVAENTTYRTPVDWRYMVSLLAGLDANLALEQEVARYNCYEPARAHLLKYAELAVAPCVMIDRVTTMPGSL